MSPDASYLIAAALNRKGPLLWLTGAGLSAESGIPTFRGPDGYWRVGSVNYHPEEMATREFFAGAPAAVWAWYLHRAALCRNAAPNAAHTAIAAAAAARPGRVRVVTQNVDGLHARAGTPAAALIEVHGNLHRMRCAAGCRVDIAALPPDVAVTPDAAAPPPALACPACGGWMRPHVLWFDEYYDETHYRFRTALGWADACGGLVVVGTQGTTSVPARIMDIALRRRVPIIVIDPDPPPFAADAAAAGGLVIAEPASRAVAVVAAAVGAPPA